MNWKKTILSLHNRNRHNSSLPGRWNKWKLFLIFSCSFLRNQWRHRARQGRNQAVCKSVEKLIIIKTRCFLVLEPNWVILPKVHFLFIFTRTSNNFQLKRKLVYSKLNQSIFSLVGGFWSFNLIVLILLSFLVLAAEPDVLKNLKTLNVFTSPDYQMKFLPNPAVRLVQSSSQPTTLDV